MALGYLLVHAPEIGSELHWVLHELLIVISVHLHLHLVVGLTEAKNQLHLINESLRADDSVLLAHQLVLEKFVLEVHQHHLLVVSLQGDVEHVGEHVL